jgi:hypothetical protein
MRCHPGSRSGSCHLSVQGLDHSSRCNVRGAPKHDVESFAVLVVAGLGVGVAIDGLHLPLGILEHHLFILLLLRIHLLFALLMAGRCTFLARLLLLFVEVFHELLDLSVLTHVVAHRVMNQALGATVVTAGCLMRALVTSWASAPTHHHSCSCGGTN